MAAIFNLQGKKGLVAGIANEHSIAYGCAKSLHSAGADILLTYGDPKAERFVTPLGPELGDPTMMLCDVAADQDIERLFARIKSQWGTLDFLVHSIAFAPPEDLHGRVIDCSREGFLVAMNISCYSFIRLAKLAEPLMPNGGCIITMSYYGAGKAVDHYNIMGPVKAALESVVRYLAAELGPGSIRVHALSPGPLATRAASGIEHFDELLDKAATRAPEHRLVSIHDVGAVAAFLVSDSAAALTGNITYVDAGYHVMA
jgi:enoyl-[acyl-carrier protein] reductase I